MEHNLVNWTRGIISNFKAVHTYNYGKAVNEADNQRMSDMEDELVHEFCAVRFMHASLAVAYGLQQSSQLLKDQMKQKASEAVDAAKQQCEGSDVTLTDLFKAWAPKHAESQGVAQRFYSATKKEKHMAETLQAQRSASIQSHP